MPVRNFGKLARRPNRNRRVRAWTVVQVPPQAELGTRALMKLGRILFRFLAVKGTSHGVAVGASRNADL